MNTKLFLAILLAALMTLSVAEAQVYNNVLVPGVFPEASGGYVRAQSLGTWQFSVSFDGVPPNSPRANTHLGLIITSTNNPSLAPDGTITIGGTDIFDLPGVTTENLAPTTWQIIGYESKFDGLNGDCFDGTTYNGGPCMPTTVSINFDTLSNAGDGSTVTATVQAVDSNNHAQTVGAPAAMQNQAVAPTVAMKFISSVQHVYQDTNNDGTIDSDVGTGTKDLSINDAFYIKAKDTVGGGNHWLKFIGKTGNGWFNSVDLDAATFERTSDKIYENFYTQLPGTYGWNIDTDDIDMYMLIDTTGFVSAYFCNYATADTAGEIDAVNCGGNGAPDTQSSPTIINGNGVPGAIDGTFYMSPNPLVGSGGGGTGPSGGSVPEFSDIAWILAAVLGAGSFVLIRKMRKF